MIVFDRKFYYKFTKLVDRLYKISPSATAAMLKTFYNFNSEKSIYIKELSCIYMPVPKVGTKSVQKIFADYYVNEHDDARFDTQSINSKGLPFSFISKKKVSRFADKCFVFSFVRNPYHRILSCYLDKIKKETSYKGFLRYGNKFWKSMTFFEFLETIQKIPDSDADQHFQSQASILSDQNNNLLPHFIGKLENFEDDFRILSHKLKTDSLKVAHQNRSKMKNRRSFLNQTTKELIFKRYEIDFEQFDYPHD